MSWPKAERERSERQWFHEACRELRQRHGGSLVSGERTPKRNARVGGKPGSQHLLDLAEDIAFDTKAGKEAAKADCGELGLHWHDSHPNGLSLHVQARPARRAS